MLVKSSTVSRPILTGTRKHVVVKASLSKPAETCVAFKKAAAAVLTAGVAVSIALSSPSTAIAAPINLAEKRQQEEAALQEQLSRLEYALQQQQTAARAEILAKRQQLENTVEQVDTAIQRKLIEEAANEQAAAKKGEELRAVRIEEEAELIKEQRQQLQVAAAKAEAQLDRQEMVEKAREVEKQQEVAKATNSIMELLGITEADLGLSK